ncbi:MAG: carbon monoxide dehydrogenase subunit G [Thaumarchaeota archaeon]|nr:carbon monoxide dehydrogenase subunit G [Nitrososphaerota archaeon]
MQLHLEGAEDLALRRERVYQLLTDSSFIAKSLPDAQETKVIDDSHLEARLKIGISFLTTNMNVKMALADKVPPQHAKLLVEGSGSGSNMKIVSDFNLEGDNPTKMKWAADADITGLMAGIGSSILKGFAEKKVKEIFEGIKQAMEKAGP